MKIITTLLIIVTLFLVSCTTEIPENKKCQVDADCVPNKCCGADDGVNKDNAPGCKGTFCTQSCTPGTIDCQQGEIKCVEGSCSAVFKEVADA